MKPLVVLPTYNEHDTLPVALIKVLDQEVFDVLIVDDNSTDGTREMARHWVTRDKRVNLLERPGKLGLGTAYIDGFRWGLARDYGIFMEMDSDLSHNPLDLTRFLDQMLDGADLVIGSRYQGGKISVVGWDFQRLLLSRMGNFYASYILDVPLSDLTSGFRSFSRRALEGMDMGNITSAGYAFQIEMAYQVWRSGMDVREIPIVFTERASGVSKMSGGIVTEAFWLPWRILAANMIASIKDASDKGRSDNIQGASR